MEQTNAERLCNLAHQLNLDESAPLFSYRLENRYQMVFGEGDPKARMMLIGEAPGAQEAESGRPFVGRAGTFLDELLADNGLIRENVYITNIVKDRPPKNRAPQKEEINYYTPFLVSQIEIIQPTLIATLGRFAMTFILMKFGLPDKTQLIGQLHGRMLPLNTPYGKATLLPLYHPAAVFYNRKLEQTIRDDFKKITPFI